MDQCSPSGSYKGEPVEGFVIRSQTHANQTFFFKVKFDEPYLMFREFREATRSILSGNHKFTPKYQLTFKYMAWVHRKKRQDPTFFQDFLKNKGIIRARNAFLIEEDLGTGFERLVELAKETVDSSAYPDSSMQKEKENVFFKSPFGTQGKLLILPIAIIGAGKTTLARVLSKICPVKFRHIQSDNMPAKKKAAYFTETIVDAFKECDVVYADKNNHLFQHRSAVIREFKATHASGLAVVLDWKAEKLNRQSVLDHCHKRILLR